MKKAILATKVGMTQIFNEDGMLIPVTVLQAGPCVVTQVKTEENDGYTSVQVGFGEIREKLVNKPEKGHFDKAGVAVKRFVKEFRFDNAGEYEVGQEIKADIFAAGDHIDATAVSKGKGFQGAIKRHGQSRGPMAHGSKYHRHAGSNGACSDPSKVFKGKHMPGHMGHVQVTVQNLEIVRVDTENNLLLVKGAVPGPKKSLVTIKVYNMEGNEVGTMELNDAVFGVEINEHLVHLAVVRQLANNRQGTQKAKTRSEVRGGGRKPWRQKGTGHARQGSIRAPQWTGGGVVFAPVPRDYEVKMNKKERRAALKSALTSKVQDNKLVVVDSLALAEVKTKEMQKVLTNLKAEKALVITADNDQNVVLSARNIADVETATPATINTYDVMKHNTVVVTKDAVASIEEVYS